MLQSYLEEVMALFLVEMILLPGHLCGKERFLHCKVA